MAITAPNYVQGQYSVADRDRIFTKADKYPDAAGGITNQVPTLTSDGKIIWRQQSSGGGSGTANANIAVVEDTSTASQAYAVGDLLVYSGQLYRVTAAIAQGATITPGTNVTPTTVADEIENGGGGGGGVSSFNSRTGAVLPQSGDYTPAMVGATPQIVYRSITLLAANWSNYSQSVTVTGVSATETDQLIQPVPAAVSLNAYQTAQVQATGQAADSLTFSCKTVPLVDLTVYVCITSLEAAT